ncbi:MAG: type II toxin-antitoxin system VapC family toxin [Candidatus Melainabacteria bacterium]|jgi:PIN domain nuclease of toxin-antitoxin system|nr:type II toxin-antitoxin system VapC family toxin [Candidatus Melainabacteria bacterium]
MNFLLDTHVLLWWLDKPALLSSQARKAIADSDTSIFVSAATIWEIIIKKSLGKLVIPDNLEQVIADNNFLPLPISFAHALAIETLPDFHRDPFDRVLVAQSICEGLTIVTRDPDIMKYPASWMMA